MCYKLIFIAIYIDKREKENLKSKISKKIPNLFFKTKKPKKNIKPKNRGGLGFFSEKFFPTLSRGATKKEATF